MIGFKIEKALTDRAVCKLCDKKILKDEMKLIVSEQGFQFTKKRTECNSCGVRTLMRNISETNKKIDILEGKAGVMEIDS